MKIRKLIIALVERRNYCFRSAGNTGLVNINRLHFDFSGNKINFEIVVTIIDKQN